MSTPGRPRPRTVRRVAIIDWSHLIEDYLDGIGADLHDLRDELTGGWLFGMVDALESVDVRTTLVTISGQVPERLRWRHRPTGATISLLPAPSAYRRIRRVLWNPYAWSVEDAATVPHPAARLPLAGLLALAPYLATPVLALARELRAQRADALICQDYEHPRFDLCVALGRMLGIPVFATFQGGDFRTSPLERFTRSLAIHRCAGLLIGPSREIRRVRREYRLPERRITHVFNPLDVSLWEEPDRTAGRRELGLRADAKVVVWHGRVLVEVKGLDVLLRAWRTIQRTRTGRSLRLLLIGDGPDAERLASMLEAHDDPTITWRREFVTDRERLARWVGVGDVGVLSSRHEGFPVAPVEAMLAGMPVVLTDVSGARDILPRRELDGGLVVPVDDHAALAAALDDLLADDARAARVGVAAARRAREAFSLEAVGRELRDALSGCQRPRAGAGRG